MYTIGKEVMKEDPNNSISLSELLKPPRPAASARLPQRFWTQQRSERPFDGWYVFIEFEEIFLFLPIV